MGVASRTAIAKGWFARVREDGYRLRHENPCRNAGLTAIVDETGRLQAIKVTWAYDAFYSLLVTEDAGLDSDGNAVLTKDEEAQLRGFDMQWIEGYNGDLVARLDGQPLELSGPRDATLIMREGRLVTTHVSKRPRRLYHRTQPA